MPLSEWDVYEQKAQRGAREQEELGDCKEAAPSGVPHNQPRSPPPPSPPVWATSCPETKWLGPGLDIFSRVTGSCLACLRDRVGTWVCVFLSLAL